MGQHGPQVSWKFFEKNPWTRCPMGINKSRIPHYLQSIQH
jgi:hypothetical protein